MNKSFLEIIKRIIAEHGENILIDPQRLKPLVSNYASSEPKEDRIAFGRAIEQSFYMELKRAAPSDIQNVKSLLVSKLQAITGFDTDRCISAVNLIEALLPNSTINKNSLELKTGVKNTKNNSNDKYVSRISNRTLLFAVAAGIGALLGEILSNAIGLHNYFIYHTFFSLILNVGLWAGLIGLGISVLLLITQTIYLKKKLVIASIFVNALFGILIGVIGGAIAQVIFGFTHHISNLVEIISRVICWGILGWGLGLGVSSYIKNFPKKRAMLSGLLGGIIGGAIFRSLFILPDPAGRIIGVTALGLIIGLFISLIEEALRHSWITVVWGPKETRTIALGQKPILFGSTNEADIYLPAYSGQTFSSSIYASIYIENNQIIFDDKINGKRNVLNNGDTVSIDKLKIIINAK